MSIAAIRAGDELDYAGVYFRHLVNEVLAHDALVLSHLKGSVGHAGSSSVCFAQQGFRLFRLSP